MASEIRLALVVNNTPATAGTGETMWLGGRGWITATSSNWNSGSVQIQYKTTDGTYVAIDATNLNFTANGLYGFEAPPGELKAAITGSPTAVNVYAHGTRVQ